MIQEAIQRRMHTNNSTFFSEIENQSLKQSSNLNLNLNLNLVIINKRYRLRCEITCS